MLKKVTSIILLVCLFSALIGCGTSTTDNSSASNEQDSSINESVSSAEEVESSAEEPEIVDSRLTKEIIMDYIDENKSDLWAYEEDKYTDDLSMWISIENIDNVDDMLYTAPSKYWNVFFFPSVYWNDEANALVFDPYISYSSAWFLNHLCMYDEIQIATDSEHMKLVIDEAFVNYDTDHSESSGSVYMIEEDMDDMQQLLEMLDNNPSIRIDPVNAEETIEFYLTDTMIMQFKEAIALYFELQEIIR